MSWATAPLRKLITPNNKRGRPDLPLLSVVRERGVIKRNLDKSDNHNVIPEDLSNYKVVRKGQFVINKMKAWQGSCGVSQYDGIVSPAYYVFDLDIDNPRFFNYAIRSKAFVDEFGRISSGIRVDQWDLSLQKLKYIPFLLPPRNEQDQIVRYLDWKVSQINKLINVKRKQIALLGEQKQVDVNEAVTRGGKGWKRLRLKNVISKIIDCPHETPDYSIDGKYYVIRTADQDFCAIKDNSKMYLLEEDEYQQRIRRSSLQKNDIVYGREGERWGFACLVPENDRYCLGQRIMQFRCDTEKVTPAFVMYALNADYVRNQGVVDTFGSTSPHVNISTIRNYSLVVPDITEQDGIVAYLENQCSRIDKIIAKLNDEIALLIEYRTRLISDAVTGKLDVRGVAVPEFEVVEDTAGDAEIADLEDNDVTEE